jgi:GNAT superfamily N-acetyltransferase
MVVKILRTGDEGVLDSIGKDVFDDPIDARAAAAFLADPRHHLAVAIEDGAVIAFVSAVEYAHPDKASPELWINEVGVASTRRGCGMGKVVLQAVLNLARERGGSEARVLTERANSAAMRLYAGCGGIEASEDSVMFRFPLA